MITISETAAQRNAEWAEAQRVEHRRRIDENLVIVSRHVGRDHWETQDEFLSWYRQTFGDSDVKWWHGSFSRVNGQTHTWLVPSRERLLICKLTWS